MTVESKEENRRLLGGWQKTAHTVTEIQMNDVSQTRKTKAGYLDSACARHAEMMLSGTGRYYMNP